ncbi:RHS repeat-associated core domain-containing protein [Microbacter margulisiae]|uniref:RHS repeat-associated protein n=1 Tax=Microbacter margulisiae TaxID=1350067 RepID=A0A7W5DRS6_9PORP|nr:RHS repeat-associated core domain-containing protein [Microbacter margulisiae]MBB3187870.1 RHS repeat-associated protein [Microbacter margulisiae]
MKEILTPEGYWQNGVYYYYLKDHLGSNREVLNQTRQVVEYSDYYPSGMRFGESVVNGGNVQPYRHTGMEMQGMHGLNWIDNEARMRSVNVPEFTTMDPLCEKYYNMSPYAYVGDNLINAIDPLGMDSCTYNSKDNTYTSTTRGTMQEVEVTAPALYKQTLMYFVFGELAFGNRRYLDNRINPHIYTPQELNRGANMEMRAGLTILGGAGTIEGFATEFATSKIGWMAFKAIADAFGQFGGAYIAKRNAKEALNDVNLLGSVLTGLGVNPFNTALLSGALSYNPNTGFQSTFTGDKSNSAYFTNLAIGLSFGYGTEFMTNTAAFKTFTIGIYMRTAGSINPSIGTGVTNSLIAAPTAASAAGESSLENK